jgi:hypothetical protein
MKSVKCLNIPSVKAVNVTTLTHFDINPHAVTMGSMGIIDPEPVIT